MFQGIKWFYFFHNYINITSWVIIPVIMHDSLVFFLPGIMGSTLRFRGVGEFGQSVDEEIWGSNLKSNIDLLATNPTKMASDNVEAGEILKEINIGWGRKTYIYKELFDFCTAQNGLSLGEADDFYPFPYDWRKDNRVTANKFADFILSVDPSQESRIKIIAHSMGGIVARLMLLQNKSIAERTDLLFQIASPIQGSAKAYYTLKKHPTFHKIFDLIWRSFHHLDPNRRLQLQSTIQQFPSLYQLLPPSSIKTLYNMKGDQYSAVDPEIWQMHLHGHISAATQVHTLLDEFWEGNIKCVYSSGCSTDMLYLVDQSFEILKYKHDVAGDGTVSCSSAIAQTIPGSRYLIEGNGVNHNDLCNHPKVLGLLKDCF